jgi:hypothetical protein
MTYYPDMGHRTGVTGGLHVRAIGWLDDLRPFPTGTAPDVFVQRLRRITDRGGETLLGLYEDSLEMLMNQQMGCHTCELCWQFEHASNIAMPAAPLLYVAPAMISHYVEVHRYLPPPAFIDAVLQAPEPGTEDYRNAVARFRPLHEEFQRTLEQERFEAAVRQIKSWRPD